MNKSIKNLFVCLIIAFSFASCHKDEAVVSNVAAPTTQQLVYPNIKNGRLYFEDMDHFKSYMETIQKMRIEDVEAMNVEHGFKSHYASGKGAANSTSSLGTRSRTSEEFIADIYFAAVLNEDHQLLIDFLVGEANNNYSYMVPEGDEDKILDFETALAKGVVLSEDLPEYGKTYYNNLYVYPTNVRLDIAEYALDGKNDKSLETRGLGATRQIQWTYFNSQEDWRLHAEAWASNWLFYASVGIESKCNRSITFLVCGLIMSILTYKV